MEEEREVLEDIGRISEPKIMEKLVHYKLNDPNSDCYFLIGLNMKEHERTELIKYQKENTEVFAWTPYVMPRIDPSFIKVWS